MKRLFGLAFVTLFLGLGLSSFNVKSQNADVIPPPSLRFHYSIFDIKTFQENSLKTTFEENGAEKDGQPYKIGFVSKPNIKSASEGSIVKWENDEISWLLRVQSKDTPGLALVFNDVQIPSDAIIYIYSETDPSYYYAITSENLLSEFVSTPVFKTSSLVVEYVERAKLRSQPLVGKFTISDIFLIYRGLPDLYEDKGLGDSAPCHVNINCSPEGDLWQNQKRGVAKMIFSVGTNAYLCSGTLINNTKQNGKPYFLTAEHCGGNASATDRNVWNFYFNYERANCSNTSTPPNNIITGSTLLAIGELEDGSDFQLLELSQAPPAEWKPYYNGWDRSTAVPNGGVSIHHPKGDIKKISTFTGSLVSSTPTIDNSQMAHNAAWRVIWAETDNGHGVTEGGSSGSPIFNSEGLVVGSLSGGSSSCTNSNYPDYYGKFNYHWESNGTTTPNQLKHWLDPDNTNVQMLSGYDPSGDLYANFKADKIFAQIEEEIIFTDLSTGQSITAWSWTFGEAAQPASAIGKGPHTITYSSGGLKTISLTINGAETVTKNDYIRIQDIPVDAILFEGFEGDVFPPQGWLNVDNDGDNYKWFSYIAEGTAYSGVKSAGSASWMQNVGPLRPDNWLISPTFEITHNSFMLEYFVSAQDPDWPKESYGVYISNKGGKISDFEPLLVEEMQNAQWQNRQIGLADYLGDIVNIAFRHFNSYDQFVLKIDDVLVTRGSDEPSDQARIHAVEIEEGRILFSQISPLENNQATIYIEVDENVDISSLTPSFTISKGATINYTPETVMDLTEPYTFTVISESALTVNDYALTVVYAPELTTTFKVFDSSQNPVDGATIQINGIEEAIVANSEGNASVHLYRGDYTFVVSADDFNSYQGSFTLIDQDAEVEVRMIRTNSPISVFEKVRVFPNPFSNTITLSGIESISKVSLLNVLGEVIYLTRTNGDAIINIPTSSLPSGIYFILVENNSFERHIYKTIKQ
jgi:hypothetical protein